jgi:DNA-binding LytR/AlgR family response regulator
MDILYIVVANRKIEIHTTSTVLTGSLMVQLDRILSRYGFVRVDKNKFASTYMMESFCPKDSKITFYGGKQCTVSRRNKKKVSSYFDKNTHE